MSTEPNRTLHEQDTNRQDRPAERPKSPIWSNLFWAAVIAAVSLLACFRVSEALSPAQSNTATCTVQANRLNLRVGPGTNYRSDGLLDKGARLRATGRNSASTWIKVTVTATGKQGWVAYGSQLATCASAISRLPVATAPPATGANAATNPNPNPNPNPLPAPIALAPLPTGGGGDSSLQGRLVTEQTAYDLVRNPNADGPNDANNPDIIVFSDRISLALDLTRRPTSGPMTHFDVSLTSNDSGEVVWSYFLDDPEALESDPYCFFGGEPDECVEVDLRAGATWPLSDIPVTNGDYSLGMYAENTPSSEDDSISSRNWFGTIRIESARLGGAAGGSGNGGSTSASPTEGPTPTLVPPVANQDPVIDFVETAPGTDDINIFESLTFQVAAWDPDVGTENGDGIDYLYMDLNDPDGNVVAWAEYNAPPFCGFGEDDGGCWTWWFADNDYTWPDGSDIVYGNYTLYVDAVGSDGSESEATLDVILQ